MRGCVGERERAAAGTGAEESHECVGVLGVQLELGVRVRVRVREIVVVDEDTAFKIALKRSLKKDRWREVRVRGQG